MSFRLGMASLLSAVLVMPACALDLKTSNSTQAEAVFDFEKHKAITAKSQSVLDWSGVWTRTGTLNWDPNLPTGEFDTAPLTPEYQAIYDDRIVKYKKGVPEEDPTAKCLPQGMPRIMNMIFSMEILQREGVVAIFAEWGSQLRHIYTDGRVHPDDPDPTYNGHSIGYWDDGDLIVNTVGLRGDTRLTARGLGLSDALRVQERFHQVDENTLTNTITLTDEKALTRPWTVMKTYKRAPHIDVMEYVCQENNMYN